jgi:hypothetical protein
MGGGSWGLRTQFGLLLPFFLFRILIDGTKWRWRGDFFQVEQDRILFYLL